MRLLVALSALGIVHSGAQLWTLALLLPLWGTHQAVRYGVFRLHSGDASRALAELDSLQTILLNLHKQSNRARRELQASQEETNLLEEMTRYLTTRPDLGRALEHVLGVAQRLGHFESLAIFQIGPEGLQPVLCRGPLQGRVNNAGLLKLSEPLALAAFHSGQPQLLRQDDATRIFAGETAALAVPLAHFGVIYAGRARHFLAEKECRGLMWMASRAGPLLEGIHRHYQRDQELSQSRQHSEVLEGQVGALSRLLHSSRQLASTLQSDQLLEMAQEAVLELIPHQAGEIWLHSQGPSHGWGDRGDAAVGLGLVSRVAQGGRPLLLPSLEGWLLPRFHSALCVPVGSGALLLLSTQPDNFSREDQDGLCLFANQLALALANAAYLQKVVETQAHLVQSSKMSAVGQLAAGIAHELNSPLGAIALALESVSRTPDMPSAPKKLERAAKAAERCRKIVEKLLVYTRLGSPIRGPLKLKELVEDTLDFFATSLDLAGYQITTELDPQATVAGHSHLLQQILVSVLLNATESYPPEFTPKPVFVGCGQDQEQAWIIVRDAGVGIAAEDINRVFEPFYTTKTIGKNVGLGLSVSLEIARQHDGDLIVTSAQGKGTEVRLTLPVA